MTPTILSLFSGLGGGLLGFVRAGFRSVGAIDLDPAAIRDLEYLTGARGTVADLGTMSPAELRALAGERRPDVVFTSPPCKGNSGCLPAALATTPKYRVLNQLAQRGLWICLEAWPEQPPPLILLENVPRIRSRSEQWLAQTVAMLQAYGYSVKETSYDCGHLGGLAQRRQRYLLVARHRAQLPDATPLFLPPLRPHRSIGEVLGKLPVPLPVPSDQEPPGGPMHQAPLLWPLNWVRLALIRAGKDWRDLPDEVALGVREARQNGGWGLNAWDEASHTVIGHSQPRVSWSSVADPRVTCHRREGSMGVKGWEEVSTAIIGHGTHHNGPWQVADPRLGYEPRPGTMGVQPWAEPSHTVIGEARSNKGANIADPRVPRLEGPPFDLQARRSCFMVIAAADGTWHRPLTTLELAILQGLPAEVHGKPLQLDGTNKANHRMRIGNAVPPPAAEAIARSMRATLEAAHSGGLLLSGQPVWVEGGQPELSGGA